MIFTIEEGLEVQRKQLADWKLKLNGKCYKALEAYCKTNNEKLNPSFHNGHMVIRGGHLAAFIHSWQPEFGAREIEMKLGQLAQDHLGSCAHRKMVAILNTFYGGIKLESSLSIAIKNSKIKTPQDLEHFVSNFTSMRESGKLESYYHGWKPLGKG